ncbi:MAG TPA: redoxin family protein [Planctomycetota bacterium]|jgi:thiol-disulfide isomerase/thioredoxin
MRTQVRALVAFCLITLAVAAVSAGEEITLKVGDPAPALSISKWLNGDAVANLEKGKVYVLECWATWCGPCVASMPHVSELNTKMKDKGVVIIGLNVWERDKDKVEPFVKKMGEKLNYRVAMDDDNNTTAKAWLQAAGRDGIPCAFVVDKATKIAWIGHPMSGLDQVVEQVAAGTFDSKKFAEEAAKQEELEKKMQAAFEAKDGDTLLKLADEMAAAQPKSTTQMTLLKFMVLLQIKKDYPAAYAMATKSLEAEWKNESEVLNHASWTILDEQGVEKRDFDVALKLALRADELTKHENAAILDTLARAYFEKGQVDKAIETETLAISKADEGMKEDLTKALEKYKAGKK